MIRKNLFYSIIACSMLVGFIGCISTAAIRRTVRLSSDIKWGDTTENSGLIRHDGVYVWNGNEDVIMFYPDNTIVHLFDVDDIGRLKEDMTQYLMEKWKLSRKISYGFRAGVYDLDSKDSILRANNYVRCEYFLFQVFWREMWKEKFKVIDDTTIVQTGIQKMFFDICGKYHDTIWNQKYTFTKVQNIPPPNTTLKKFKWMWREK
ncbi:MAG: hypothetical protein J5610_06305 [Prevotella sp.]|nr:hypothetical protein [Prevotella sp.]